MNPKAIIKRILVPIDFSFTSLKALDQAVLLSKNSGASITLLHIVEHLGATTDPLFAASPRIINYESELRKISYDNLQKVADKLKKKGIHNVKTLTVMGRTHLGILETCKKYKSDIVIMGTHGTSGVQKFFMGSNTFRVVSDAVCPVLSVQRKNKTGAYKNILMPFTDRPHSREKVIYSIKMAKIFGSTLHILGVDTEGTRAQKNKIELQAEQIQKIVNKNSIPNTLKVVSAPYESNTVLPYGKKVNADLIIIMGESFKQNIVEYFTGSFAQQVINHSVIPVLSIPPRINPKMVELWQGL